MNKRGWSRSKGRLRGRLEVLRERSERGMATAEYAVGTIAAAAFATVLYKIVKSGSVSDGLESVIGKALDASF